jgi:microcin C transport system substrate-binding protein
VASAPTGEAANETALPHRARRAAARPATATIARRVLVRAWLCVLLPGGSTEAACGEPPATPAAAPAAHAASWFDETRYPSGFAHFDWVDPAAPKGGRLNLGLPGTWDSCNVLIPRGQPPAGLAVSGRANWLYDRLLEEATDDRLARYGRLARSVAVAADGSSVTFELRPEARWHDGVPITADDVVFTFEQIKAAGSPVLRTLYRDVTCARTAGPHAVRFEMARAAARDAGTVMALGQLFPLPAHYWRSRAFDRTTTEPPLGSGPYRIGQHQAPRFVEYERVPDYWGRDLPVNRGRFNFDTIRYEYFLDENALRETLEAGGIDAHVEVRSKSWATAYEVPAVEDGVLVRRVLPVAEENGAGGVPFVLNARRRHLADVRVREALWLARDFEWNNRVLYHDQYERVRSMFVGSPLQSDGLPSAAELALLAPHRSQLPAAVFAREYRPPASTGTGMFREPLAAADRVLQRAGFIVRDGVRVHAATGERLAFEILVPAPPVERMALPYAARLARLGIGTRVRTVESSQFIARTRRFDFDIAVVNVPQQYVPGAELRDRFGSAAAAVPSSSNLAGIRDPVVDALIEHVIAAGSLPELRAAGRALDRVLLWNFHVVPGLRGRGVRLVYWDRFGIPERMGEFDTGFPDTWWHDAARAARVDAWLARSRRD